MEKELHEHPAVIGDTLHQHGQSRRPARSRCRTLPFDFATVPRITISACGSAFYAGLVGRWWFEAIARIPTDADVASEFRYRDAAAAARAGSACWFSQSGETADTLAALRYMREQGQHVLSMRQRAGKQHGARERRGAGDGGGAGDRRGLHQGVHRAACPCWPAWRWARRGRAARSPRRRKRR